MAKNQKTPKMYSLEDAWIKMHGSKPFELLRLNFADAPSFTKFFSRMKGMSPREYRNIT